MRMRRGIICAAAATGLVAGLAACGQEPGTSAATTPTTTAPSPPPPSPTPSSPSSAPPATTTSQQRDEGLCDVDELDIKFGNGDAAAGTVYRPLLFTNIDDEPCTLHGFPGVSFVTGSDQHQLGPAAFREGEKGAAVKLAPGETASADVGFVQVRNYDPGTCVPTPYTGVRVYPPQEYDSKVVPLEGTGCAAEKIPGNQLTVKTIVKG
ncbi:DUF4232 domain-containing protein [Amycolatopsis suaedae]|uniref:DUF4232 domain-containing protein n=1 Tax=Amycolatopsis suaedae TaxID=2510978 RepID=A0A4Q7J4W5_9PSEU|nr:DUF4232 domain-containing protein [Amycolatopsis suaedae]RZQ62087.1 DUF4232 domain-containing protein [Amycolatopsis suaedae]